MARQRGFEPPTYGSYYRKKKRTVDLLFDTGHLACYYPNMNNRKLRANILKYLYEQWEEEPQRRFAMSELFDPLKLSPPENIREWNDDTKALWRNIHALQQMRFIDGTVNTEGAVGIHINMMGIEDHEQRSRPWLLKVWDAATKPEYIVSLITLIIGVLLGAYIS